MGGFNENDKKVYRGEVERELVTENGKETHHANATEERALRPYFIVISTAFS